MLTPEHITEVMYSRDSASQALGMSLDKVGRGYALMSMKVRDDMLNGHRICHGGFVFLLADSTFAFASNSYNKVAVGASVDITHCAPAHLGDVLTAESEEVALYGRSGVYDVRVSNQDGTLIALFRGKSRIIPGEIVSSND